MAKPEWGVKRACPSCATRFYDLMRDPITCPACGETFAAEVFARPRRGKAALTPSAAKAAAAKPAVVEEDEEVVVEKSSEATDDLTEDDDVLDLDQDETGATETTAKASGDSEDEALADFPDEGDVAVEDEDDVLDDDDDVSLEELGEAEVDVEDEQD